MEINPTIVQSVVILQNGQEQGVEIPSYAYVSEIKVSVKRIADLSILGTSLSDINQTRVSDVLKFEPSGSVFRSSVIIFLVADRQAAIGKRLAIFKLNELTQQWQEQLNSTTDLVTRKVSVYTLSFSYWTVMEVPEENVVTPASPEDGSQKPGKKSSPGTPQVIIISVFSGLAGLVLCFLSARQIRRIKSQQLPPRVLAYVIEP